LPCEVARLLPDRALCEAAPDIGNRPLIRAQALDEGRGFRPRRLRRSRSFGQLPGRNKQKAGSRLLVSPFPEINSSRFVVGCDRSGEVRGNSCCYWTLWKCAAAMPWSGRVVARSGRAARDEDL
jgi:hypothetical protein